MSGLFLALFVVLIAGAINRIIDKSERTADGGAEGTGRGQSAGRGHEVSQSSAVAGRGGYGDSTGDEWVVTGQADAGQWITLNGTVFSVDESALAVALGDGQIISLENRLWSFARDEGFATATSEEISLTGFYEGDVFEVGQINNLSNEAMVQIREESGRPLWAAGGRQATRSLG